MSYINEALKKAQELKDSGCARYYNMPESAGKTVRPLGIRLFLYSMSAALLILFAVLGYRWLDASHKNEGARAANADKGPLQKKDAASDRKELYDKAVGLYEAGRIEDAKKVYEAVIALDPGHIEALNNLGIIYIHDGDFDAARETLEKTVRLNPGYVESYYNLACLYALTGETDQGLKYLEKAVSLNPDVREWAVNDSDLRGLRSSDGYKKLVLQ